MGRGRSGKQRTQRRDFGPGKRENTWDERRTQQEWSQERFQLSNADFEEYYKQQNIVPEGEWQAFMDTLRKPLPITFRINGSGQFANEVRDKLQSDFFANFSEGAIMIEDELVQPPRPLPWYPNNLAWHMDFSRGQLRKLPWLSSIHEFMKAANESGVITRQEAVSMVPPLFMDVQPHHMVLDICAAPGSKTFQLLEALHTCDGIPSGLVMANDVDAQRCNLLTHQTKRMCSPCLVIANHPGQDFPCITSPAGDQQQQGQQQQLQQQQQRRQQEEGEGSLLYDRILCDVPCSGDGTMRKAPDIWRRWTVNNGNGLHTLQLRIALRGARLLKVGGIMVYSTCTFNPIEDEAVVSELLLRCKGALELVDVSSRLPDFKRLPGLTTWRVKDKFQWYDTWEEAQKVGFKLDPSMFPSPEKSALPLQRCMRILPHHQDTGGFFVAVLRKVGPLGHVQDSNPHKVAKSSMEGTDPLASAAAAAAYACESAEKAIAALEAGDAGGAEAAELGAKAAMAKVQVAQEALKEQQAQQQARERQPSKRQRRQQDQDVAAAAANGINGVSDAAGAAAGGGDEGDGVAEGGQGEPGADEAMAADGEGAAQNGEEDAEADMQEDAGPGPASTAEAADSGSKAAPSWVRGGGARGRDGGKGRKGIDPIFPVEDPAILQSIVDFYGLDAAFPISTHLITRSLEGSLPKRLYYLGDAILRLLLADTKEALRVVMTGLKLFERHEQKDTSQQRCKYRIAQEGLPFLLPHISKQVIRLKTDDLIRLLSERSLPTGRAAQQATNGTGTQQQQQQQEQEQGQEQAEGTAAASEPVEQPASRGSNTQNGNQVLLDAPYVVQQLASFNPGGGVCLLEDADAAALGFATGTHTSGALTASAPIALAVWRTRVSLSVLVNKNETAQLLEKLREAQKKAAAKSGATEPPAAASADSNGAVAMDTA